MSTAYRVAFLGLRALERETLDACLRLTQQRTPRFERVAMLDDAELLVADADDPPAVQLVLASERLATTVFVGSGAPLGAAAWVPRPIDAQHLLRELDGLVVRPGGVSVDLPLDIQTSAAAASSPPLAATSAAANSVRLDTGDRRRRPPPSPAAPPPPTPPAPTALLVDDSEIALRFLETRLQRWGLVMDRALSSGRAIEMMAQRHYDFVFLDVELGTSSDLDGLALCQHIKRTQERQTTASAVVMVSAKSQEMDRVRGSLAGCDAYLSKPLNDVDLQRLMLRHGLKARTAEG
jgi:CheY-like chemotaxis protein